MIMKKANNISYDDIKKQIDSGKSSHDAAMSLGVSKTYVLKKAKEVGLKFINKSYWKVL